MNRLWMLALLLSLSGIAGASGVYKWTDKNGRVHYSDKPVHSAEKVQDKPGTAAADVPPSEEARRKRDAECKQQQEQLELYKQAARLVEKDNLGNEREYTAEDKQKLIDLNQAKVQAACAPAPTEAR